MRTPLAGLLVLLAAACAGGPAAQPGDSPPLALQGVTVIDGTGAAPRPGMTVLIRDGRIAGLFAAGARPLPPGTRVLDLRGHYVIPGLIDSHAHLATFDRGTIYPALLRSMVMGGVTTLRDMGGNAVRVSELARDAATDTAPSPRIYFSAVVAGPRWFETYDSARIRYWSSGSPPGQGRGVRLLRSDADIPSIVQEARAMGATGIKVFSAVPPARLAALTRAAHGAGLRVWSHGVVPPTRPDQVVQAGADVLSHGDQMIWAADAPGEAAGGGEGRSRLMRTVSASSPPITALLEGMRARGTMLDPTLFIIASSVARGDSAGRVRGDSIVRWAVEVTRRAHELGVPVVAGTDAIGTVVPNIHAELQLLVGRAGFSPLEAIRSATERAAQALGAQDSLGTIAPGKVADLVVLRADPSADIRNTQTVAYVVQRGRVHRRETPLPTPEFAEPPPSP
jgi:hypothetical protein